MTDYLGRLLKAAGQGAFKPGEFVAVSVLHDPSCRAPQGQQCTCAPDITAESSTERFDIDPAGTPNEGGAA